MNATIAKTIAQNSPKYRKIIEPFGDGGTYALYTAKKPAKEHVINIVDEVLYQAFIFVQGLKSADRAKLKKLDWISSPETFESVSKITATEGAEALYRFLYVKNFGMRMDPEQPPVFDILTAGQDISHMANALPMMKAFLKRATITNDEPMSLITGADSDTFLILLPQTTEDSEAVQSRLGSIGGNVFCAYKVADETAVLAAVSKYSNMNVTAKKVASIMMSPMAIVSSYDSSLVPMNPDGTMDEM